MVALIQPEVGVGAVFFAGSVRVAVDDDEGFVGVDGEVEIGFGFDRYGVGVDGNADDGDEYGGPVEAEGDPVEVAGQLVREADHADEA